MCALPDPNLWNEGLGVGRLEIVLLLNYLRVAVGDVVDQGEDWTPVHWQAPYIYRFDGRACPLAAGAC